MSEIKEEFIEPVQPQIRPIVAEAIEKKRRENEERRAKVEKKEREARAEQHKEKQDVARFILGLPYYDSETGAPFTLTDEEYEAARPVLYPEKQEDKQEANGQLTVVTALKVLLAILIIGGFILGIVSGFSVASGSYSGYYNTTRHEFSFVAAATVWGTYAFYACLLAGFIKIIELLKDIRDRTK